MTRCKFCAGTVNIEGVNDIITHIRIQHTKVPGNEEATMNNIDRLVREVAKCWQGHEEK
jgi:hypothetical protein